MKTLIVYTSQTGFTKKYAEWLGERLKGEFMVMPLKEAQKHSASFFDDFQAIAYGGWAMAGKVTKSKWFLDKAASWRDKRLAMFCVGGAPAESRNVEAALKSMLTDEQREYIKPFYCPGGFNYERMSAASRFAMKIFISSLKKKKDATDEDRRMAELISTSYDISDKKYAEPIAEYLEGNA